MTACKFKKGKQKGYHFTECGLDYVYLLNGYEIEEDPVYGELFSIHDSESLHREIAKNIVLHKKELTWQELRFLRKELGMTQSQMAKNLSKSLRHYQRYEVKNGDVMPIDTQSLVRVLYWDFYLKTPSVMDTLKEIQDSTKREQHIYMQLLSDKTGWQKAA